MGPGRIMAAPNGQSTGIPRNDNAMDDLSQGMRNMNMIEGPRASLPLGMRDATSKN